MQKYGLLVKITTEPGKRDALSDILLEAAAMMKKADGMIRYDVHHDLTSDNVIWVTEIWDSEADHDNALTLPGVGELIGGARSMIAGFEPTKLSTLTS